MRTFLAIAVPEKTGDEIARLQDELRPGRKVSAENLHLTLAFLGDLDVGTLSELHAECEALALPAFDLRLAGLATFGGARPRALVFEAQGGEALTLLHQWTRRVLRNAGIAPPKERFRPHVTIARFPRDMSPEDLRRLGGFLSARADTALPAFRAGAVTLYRSHLTAEGADYEPLAEYPLRPPVWMV